MNSRNRLFVIGASLVAIASIIYAGTSVYTSKVEVSIAQMTAATNCQTDVLAPFVQARGLGQTKPSDEEKVNFQAFVDAQVKVGRISRADGEAVIAGINKAGQGLPIYSSRGWVLPLIAKNFQP